MKWFDRWFAKKVRYVWDNHKRIFTENDGRIYHGPDVAYQNQPVSPISLRETRPRKDYVYIKLWFSDNGGYVVEFNKYDPSRDRHDNELFIIPDGIDNLGTELTQILTHYVISKR